MKICLINNLYEPYARGGAEKITKTIADGLIRAGHEIFIITTKPSREKSLISDPRRYYLNSLYYDLKKMPKFLRLFWQIWNLFNFLNYFRIKKILRAEKCQAVITNNLMGVGFLTPLAIRRLGLKHLHIVHDIQLIHPGGLIRFGEERAINGQWARNYAGLTARLFDSPQTVIFPSRWLLDRYLDKIFFIKSKRVVLPNPIALKAVDRPPAGQIFKFLYLGQIEKHKGLSLLIQAYKKLRTEFSDTELIIAGSGAEFESAKLEAGADRSIKFLGRQSEIEVQQLLKTCQVLVMPTLCYENCPTVILEAFSARLPILAADLGGISELLGEDAAGLLFRPGNAADLAEKMAWAIGHREELAAMAKAGRDKADKFSIENYIKELEKLIN